MLSSPVAEALKTYVRGGGTIISEAVLDRGEPRPDVPLGAVPGLCGSFVFTSFCRRAA
jgi:hypothetical protein